MIDHQPSKKYNRRPGVEPIGQSTFQRLKQAYRYIHTRGFDKALVILSEMEKNSENKLHEHALVLQTYGHLYAQKDDYKKSLEFFELCLNMRTLHESVALSTMYTTAQLNHSLKYFARTIEILTNWMAMSSSIHGDAYVLMASAYSELGHFEEALAFMEKAVSGEDSPKESWLQFLLALQYETKQYDDAIATLNKMVELFPAQSNYWRELASLYMRKDQVERSLLTLKLAEEGRFVEMESEIFSLVSMYIDQNRADLAAKLLDRALKDCLVVEDANTYEILAGAWRAAGKYSLSERAMEKASKLLAKENIVS